MSFGTWPRALEAKCFVMKHGDILTKILERGSCGGSKFLDFAPILRIHRVGTRGTSVQVPQKRNHGPSRWFGGTGPEAGGLLGLYGI